MKNQDKFVLQSKTVVGLLISIFPIILPLFGISFSEDDAQFVSQSADSAITLIGSAVALYGRVKAESKVRFFKE